MISFNELNPYDKFWTSSFGSIDSSIFDKLNIKTTVFDVKEVEVVKYIVMNAGNPEYEYSAIECLYEGETFLISEASYNRCSADTEFEAKKKAINLFKTRYALTKDEIEYAGKYHPELLI